MKSLKWIVLASLMAALAFGSGCSKDDEPSVPQFEGISLIQDGKIYIRLYAPKGMKYDPRPLETLPFEVDVRDTIFKIFFEGEYRGEHRYWMHHGGSSTLTPHLLSSEGKIMDQGVAFKEVDYTKLTCIYKGSMYPWCER